MSVIHYLCRECNAVDTRARHEDAPVRCLQCGAADTDPFLSIDAATRAAIATLEAGMGVTVSWGYLGNCGPGFDDRSWSAAIKSMPVSRYAAEQSGRGPWSHRASGISYPSTRSWTTAELPTVADLVAAIRARIVRERDAIASATTDDLVARSDAQAFDALTTVLECEGHPAGPFAPMGETTYCDGSCRVSA